MNKFARILLLLLPISVWGQEQTPVLTAQAEDLKSGEASTLTLSLTNEGEAIYNGFQFDIFLPEGVTLSEEEGVIALQLSERYQDSDIAARIRDLGEGRYRMIGYSLSNASITGHEGILVTLTLKGSDDLEAKEYVGKLSDVVLSRTDGYGLECEASEFNITVPGTMMGDVNFDGTVDVTDVMLVVGQILGEPHPLFHFRYADMNADKTIDVIDAMQIVGIILNTQ